MKNFILLIIVLLFLSDTVFANKKPFWLKTMESITLLKSTRSDVLKLLGQPEDKNNKGYSDNFDIKNGELSVRYSTGTCFIRLEDGVENQYGVNVPKWIVVDVTFTPKKKISPKKLKVDFSKGFRVEYVHDVPDVAIYYDDKTGVNYTVNKGKIEDISFSLSDEMLLQTSCKSNKERVKQE